MTDTNVDKILEILKNHHGMENAIPSKQIAELLDIEEDATHMLTRALIKRCVKEYNLPLGATSNGYFLITTDAECEEYMKNLDARISGIQQRKEMVYKNYIDSISA